MTDQPPLSGIIQAHPIGKGLDAFRASFQSICEDRGIPYAIDALSQLDKEEIQNVALGLLVALQSLPIISDLRQRTSHGVALRTRLLKLISAVTSDDFDLDRIKPLLKAALADDLNDTLIWDHVYKALIESTPPPRPIASSLQQTPSSRNMGSIMSSSEYRKSTDSVLKDDLGTMYVDVPHFHETILGGIQGLGEAAQAIFGQCCEEPDPLFHEGWTGWPPIAEENAVATWLADLTQQVAQRALAHRPTPQRRLVAEPNKPLVGSTAKRKLDVGLVTCPEAITHWSQILIPGELKRNSNQDSPKLAWGDIGRYVREVLSNQGTRRFVLAFTLCGPLMRVWEFDRLGPIASSRFNVNQDGLRLVSTILGFIWANEEELGFDPTIVTLGDQQYMEIRRNGTSERLVIDEVMRRAACIGGRATTCWKAHPEGNPSTTLVIKDSWQYPERDEEGDLFREVTGNGVQHVARYYHHETIHLEDGRVDDVQGGIRKGLDIRKASNYRQQHSDLPEGLDPLSISQNNSITGQKRSSSQTGSALPLAKRSRSVSPIKPVSGPAPSNRVHRRIILRDYGKSIYEASSPAALLAALGACIQGHESLYRAHFLHRDISINNLIITKDEKSPLYPAFLIDLDLAVRIGREKSSGARGKTGTRAFMAIGILLDEQHSFMHDLESFFWVLFWICIHYDGPGKDIGNTGFENWNYEHDERLAHFKKGIISDEVDFLKIAKENFTPYYQSLVLWVNRLRRVVFPNGERWKKEDDVLYSRMREILYEAQDL